MSTYQLLEETLIFETDIYTVYGIRAITNEESVLVGDITTDRGRMEKLIALCNRLQLSSIQLYDVIVDFLLS